MTPMPLLFVGFFLLTTLLALAGFAKAIRGSKRVIAISIAWMAIQSALALTGFYQSTDALPPRFLLASVPPILCIAACFLTPAGRRFLDAMDLKGCVLLHTVRVLVELNLYWLFLYKQVPALMTFEAGNLDILAGISAPIIWWAYSKGHIAKRGLFVWNSLALMGVFNAFVRAILSAPFPFQRFAFDQPTVAILTFPVILLPAFIVPAVLLCHIVTFRKLSA
jgi:hypothetical protein